MGGISVDLRYAGRTLYSINRTTFIAKGFHDNGRFRDTRCLPLPESHTKIISICSSQRAPIPPPSPFEVLRHWSQRAGSFAMRNDADCARPMAEVERVLHELALFTRRSSPERSSPANEAAKAPSRVPATHPMDRLA